MKHLLLVGLSAMLGWAVQPQPSADAIIHRSVAASQKDWNEAPRYSFTDREVISKRGGARTVRTFRVLMIDGSPYNQLIAINDQPLSPEQQADEERKRQREIAKRGHESKRERSRRMAKYLKERNQDHLMMTEMVTAFEYRLEGEAQKDGRSVWVLAATPKPGYIPRSRETKVLSGMQGRLWVDEQTYHWVRVEAEVIKPVSFYGFLARVGPGTRFVLEQEPVDAGVWLPKHFSMAVNASALGFINESSVEEDTYTGYRAVPGTSATTDESTR